jgi:hypothetical protein
VFSRLFRALRPLVETRKDYFQYIYIYIYIYITYKYRTYQKMLQMEDDFNLTKMVSRMLQVKDDYSFSLTRVFSILFTN